MSKQWGHGFYTGSIEGRALGESEGAGISQWTIANEMRVILCALITSHKREDENAFWATVEIAKVVIGKYADFDDGDWAVFRSDQRGRGDGIAKVGSQS